MINTIRLSAKHDDRFSMIINKDDGTTVEHDGYALYVDGLGGGSYTNLTIDNATGCIVGWVPLTEDQLTELFEE